LVGSTPSATDSPALAADAVRGWGVAFMTGLAGASNARARRWLDWKPTYPTWREGFVAEFREAQASSSGGTSSRGSVR
jgi:hypothetical protein